VTFHEMETTAPMPVVVGPYDPAWSEMFEREREAIQSALADPGVALEHVGSTAVPGLAAKPKIDILVGLRTWDDLDAAVEVLLGIGYTHERQLSKPEHFSLRRGRRHTTHRVHLVVRKGKDWRDVISFRDALRADADLAARYGQLKQDLAHRHADDLSHEAYMNGKASFIEAVLAALATKTPLQNDSVNAGSGATHLSDFTLIPVSEESVPLLARWLSDPRVLEFYEGRDSPYDEDMVRTQFLGPDEYIERFIVYHSRRPIGYLQLYSVHPAKRPLYGVGGDEVPFGMDLFIGEPDLWGRGLGSRLVQKAAAYLVAEQGATSVYLDPHTRNTRAIRAYSKAGFQKVRLLPKHELHEGEMQDAWLMEYRPQSAVVGRGRKPTSSTPHGPTGLL
jgi:aminoglycoside 6'-N-acetyltransferase